MDGIGDTVRRVSRHSSDRWLSAWALGYAAIGAASLLVPLYALELGAGPFVAGALEATAGLAGVPGALVWGTLADRTGRRRAFVLLSLLGSGASLALFPWISSIQYLLAVNAVLWFLVAAATPVLTLFMIEESPEREWEARIGVLNAYQRYGWVGGLLIGAVWLWLGTRMVAPLPAQRSFFIVCAIGAFLATPLAFVWLPPEATTHPRRLTRSAAAVVRLVSGSGRYLKLIPFAPARALLVVRSLHRRRVRSRFTSPLRRYFLTVLVFSTGFATFFGPVPAYLIEQSYPSSSVFGFFILASLASAMLFVPVGKLASERHPKSLQLTALSVRTVLFPAFGAIALLSGIALRGIGLAGGFVLLGITWAVVVVTGAGIVSRSAARVIRGEALGVFTALSGVGGGLGGLLGGYVALVLGYQIAFTLSGAIVLSSVLLLVRTEFAFETSPGEGDETVSPSGRSGSERGSA
ncbi:MAG: MFS transporter [Halodesulfurarchaeum sp.]